MRYIILLFVWLGLTTGPLFSSTATCSWKAVTTYTNGMQIQGTTVSYKIYRSLNANLSGAILVGTTTNLSLIDNTAPRRTNCYYFARAVVDGKESANTIVVRFFTNKP